MTYFITLTSQGQISIPAEVRRVLDLSKNSKLILELHEDKNEISLKPAANILDAFGSLNHLAIKNKSIDEIMALEEKAIEEAMLERLKHKK